MNYFKILPFLCLLLFSGENKLRAEIDKKSEISSLIIGAKDQIKKTLSYNPAYKVISYPNGDVPISEGVCTDVVIRAFRALGIDLQRLLHEDMKSYKSKYPKLWSVTKLDSNIDHRRVPNLMTFFDGVAKVVDVSEAIPGDIVVWDLTSSFGFKSLCQGVYHKGRPVLHIGILSDNIKNDTPLVIHNICCGVQEENFLRSYKILKIYRFSPEIINKMKSL